MCGIAGQVRCDGEAVAADLLERMCLEIVHRGPDSRGMHVQDGAGLAIQRLRVIDLDTGDQPIYNEDGSVAVVLNGEIYNYRELRRQLEKGGHRFSTASDTEVIAHLYEQEGADCVRSLHGMFAFAVWDRRRRQLVLARDRVGKKPLFYCVRNGVITFASTLTAVLADKEVPRDLDHRALDAYLAFRYVPSPLSAFSAVSKLPPATTLVFRDGSHRLDRYWRLDYGSKLPAGDEREQIEELRERIRRAVRRRMIADVPLGAFLSGGIDSSAVVAAMAEASPEPVRTFSIGFASDRYDELPQARLIAERFGTQHEELIVEPHAIEILPKLVRHYGEPFADSSAIPSFYLAEMARRSVTVALNGDGGDESFAGYTRYVSNLALQRATALPLPLRSALGRIGTALPPSGRIDTWRSRVRRFSMALALEPAERHTAYMTDLNGLDRDDLYTPDFRRRVEGSLVGEVIGLPYRESTARDALDVMLDVDVQTYLPDDLLVKMDVATMAHSLEARSPLLDHELMEFAAALPPSLKLRRMETKFALRAALRGWVPDDIVRAPKRGFRLPIADWLRGDLRGYARDLLLDPVARDRGYFRPERVRLLLDRHASGAEDRSHAIWTLLVFEIWQREFVDRSTSPSAAGPAQLSSVA